MTTATIKIRRAWLGAAMGTLLLVGCGAKAPEPGQGPAATPLAAVLAEGAVVAEARVLPLDQAALGLPGGGQVVAVAVEEGDEVKAGAELVRVSGAASAASLLDAQAALVAAEAELARVEKGAGEAALAAAQAAVDVAQADALTAGARVTSAGANLSKVQSGSADAVAIAERRLEQAKNARWGFQAQRDAICGRVKEKLAFTQADCDQAQANVQEAEEGVRIAELELGRQRRGVAKEDVAVAQAQVGEATGGRAAAAARVRQAQVELDRLRRGASGEELAIARAGVDRALANLELAQIRVDETVLTAPFAGVVAAVDARKGQRLAPGETAVQLAGEGEWHVETEDLTELSVVGIQEGDPVTVSIDAIPGLELKGKVASIRSFGENRLGDITYRVTVDLAKQDKRLRWNMTATARIEASGR